MRIRHIEYNGYTDILTVDAMKFTGEFFDMFNDESNDGKIVKFEKTSGAWKFTEVKL